VKGRWEVAGESVDDDAAVGSAGGGVGRGDIGGMSAFITTERRDGPKLTRGLGT